MKTNVLSCTVIGYDGHILTLRAVCDDIDYIIDHKIKVAFNANKIIQSN